MRPIPWTFISIACLLLFTSILYYPGLYSVFLLDDYANIAGIQFIEQYGYPYYIFSGTAGPSGRPLSLLSFALQHQSWPQGLFFFKLVNLLIHLLNGVLIFFICRLLATPLQLKTQAGTAIALLATALWLLHPIQISTVLYAVQRMTQLSTFFMLLSLCSYLCLRIGNPELSLKNLAGMGIAVVLGMLLGILSKESAILLPLYILVIEYTLLTELPKTRTWKIWAAIFLLLPLFIIFMYFAITFNATLESYIGHREFTAIQRLLTQPMILFDYLHSLILPHPSLFSLFHDDYVFSTNLITPPITLLAIISWAILLCLALLLKTGRYSVIAFAILWFFCGHLLEASHLNLELYFEHRNYLPSLGIFFLLAWLAVQAWCYFANKRFINALIIAFYALLIANSIYQIVLWSDPLQQANEWQRLHPKSARALDHLTSLYLELQQYQQAIKTAQGIKAIQPLEIAPDVREIQIYTCLLKQPLPEKFWQNSIQHAEYAKPSSVATIATLNSLSTDIVGGNCQITLQNAHRLIYLMLKLAVNENFSTYKEYLHEFVAKLSLHINAPEAALTNINTALEIAPSRERYMLKIQTLFRLNMLAEAKNTLDAFKAFVNKNPKYWLSNRKIIAELELQWLELSNHNPNLKDNAEN